MTRKDYSTIQRNLGYIEGILAGVDDDKGARYRISLISSILKKEEELEDACVEVPEEASDC